MTLMLATMNFISQLAALINTYVLRPPASSLHGWQMPGSHGLVNRYTAYRDTENQGKDVSSQDRLDRN